MAFSCNAWVACCSKYNPAMLQAKDVCCCVMQEADQAYCELRYLLNEECEVLGYKGLLAQRMAQGAAVTDAVAPSAHVHPTEPVSAAVERKTASAAEHVEDSEQDVCLICCDKPLVSETMKRELLLTRTHAHTWVAASQSTSSCHARACVTSFPYLHCSVLRCVGARDNTVRPQVLLGVYHEHGA